MLIDCEEEGEIKQVQRDAYEALMQNWEKMQHKIAIAILEYYNEEELVKKIHLDAIVI